MGSRMPLSGAAVHGTKLVWCLVAVRPSERENHTRLGWWVMTHDRGGSLLIGTCFLALFVADVAYALGRWDGPHGSFTRAFALGFVALMIFGSLLALARRARLPIGAYRKPGRRHARVEQVASFVFVLVWVRIARGTGDETAFTLGTLAVLAGSFVVYVIVWVLRAS
jgi:hypothetical protein